MKCINSFWERVPSPCYLIDLDELYSNLGLLQNRCNDLGIRPLLAIKGFPLALLFRDIAPYVHGISASSPFEAKLGKNMGKEIHIHAPAYKPEDICNLMQLCDHVVFNSIGQWDSFRSLAEKYAGSVSCGIRINPEYSEVETDKYNPCLPYSRFGVTSNLISLDKISGIEGFHTHVMCDQGAKTLSDVIDVVVNRFGNYFPQIKWINFGGGHKIADPDYEVDLIKDQIARLTSNYGLKVYIEPCEGIVTSSGYLICSVLDIVENGKKTAILDTSALCHMPDVLDMPYQPDIVFPNVCKEADYSYILAGISCLPGDIIGEYSFESPLHIGDRIVFSDMGAYTFARENYFNGINFPSISIFSQDKGLRVVKKYLYENYEQIYL